jgi:curved DNA-binding protein CbpA
MATRAHSPLLFLSGGDLGRVVWYDGLYELLGVPASASEDDIKRAYRRQAKRWHPDPHRGDARAAERMVRLNEARELLSCERLRLAYDWLR